MARTVIDQDKIKEINISYIKNKTYAAVARELGIAASTVKKYIIPIKPIIPVRGRIAIISTILIAESETAVQKENACSSSPFKIPSEILSRYISGTIGAKNFSKMPTS